MTGKVIRKEKLNKHEQDMWDALQDHSELFTRVHGFNLDDVKSIGVRKFLKMEGWKGPEDVLAFTTDAMHVAICPHCMDEFGIAEDIYGLCHKCKPKFDIKQLMDLSTLVGQQAAVEFTKDKGISDEEKAVLMENAIKYAEFAFRMFIKEAALTAKSTIKVDDEEISNGTLLVKAVFLKDKNLVLRTENIDRINDLFDSAKKVVVSQLGQVYVFDSAKTTEV